jgi:hypothetical protein
MTDVNVTRIGQINQIGAVDALFLKVFAGEVLTPLDAENLGLKFTQVRTISHGKSVQ